MKTLTPYALRLAPLLLLSTINSLLLSTCLSLPAALPSGPPLSPLYVTNRSAAALAAALNVPTNLSGLFTTNPSAAALVAALNVSTNLSALYTTNTSAAALAAALNVGTNGGGFNGSGITNINVNSITGQFSGTFQVPVNGWIQTDGNSMLGNSSYSATYGQVIMQQVTNTFYLTNVLTAWTSASQSHTTNAYFFVFLTQNSNDTINVFTTFPAYSNIVTLPVASGSSTVGSNWLQNFSVSPAVPVTAGQWVNVVMYSAQSNSTSLTVPMWYNSPGNTSIPRPGLKFVNLNGSVSFQGPLSTYASAAYVLSGYIGQSVTNLVGQIAALGGLTPVTNASQINYINTLSGLSGNSIQSAIDQTATNLAWDLANLNAPSMTNTHQNVIVGQLAALSPTISNSVAIGYAALSSDYTTANLNEGLYNTALGYEALQFNTIGNHNTAAGFCALRFVTTGIYNSGFGEDTLLSLTNGGWNCAFGTHALQNATNSYNSAFGCTGLTYLTNGFYDTALGYAAGAANFSTTPLGTGSELTLLGAMSGTDGNGFYTNSTALGFGATVTANNQVVIGSNITQVVTSGVIVGTNGTAYYQLGNIPTSSVPVSVAGSSTNWLIVNLNGIPTLVATNQTSPYGWLTKPLWP